jgi:hypothetical protein
LAFSANAEEAAPGKIVTFQVENLDGVEGNKGVVKLQLQPAWAPQGVERFEVSLCVALVGWSSAHCGTMALDYPAR